MTIPDRREAMTLLASLQPPSWLLRHSQAVADVAAFLARRTAAGGRPVDVAAVEAAALLHDVDKAIPPDDPARGLPHGDGSAAWLAARGHGELASLVRDHPVTRLAEEDAVARIAAAPLEVRIVAYADKRAGQRLEPMDARFASWRRRYPAGPRESGGSGWDDETARLVRARADALEAEICTAASVRPEDVRRLRWSGRSTPSRATGGRR